MEIHEKPETGAKNLNSKMKPEATYGKELPKYKTDYLL